MLKRGDKRFTPFSAFCRAATLGHARVHSPAYQLLHALEALGSWPGTNLPNADLPLPVMKVRSGCVLWCQEHWQVQATLTATKSIR